MRKVVEPKIEFAYEEKPDNEQRVQLVYNRILEIAKKNILTGNLIKLTNLVTISAKARIINDHH
jgi:hypothetical protein